MHVRPPQRTPALAQQRMDMGEWLPPLAMGAGEVLNGLNPENSFACSLDKLWTVEPRTRVPSKN